MKYISVRGARMHNLKNIDIDIPRHSLVVITGLSGSGKSTLAFDTIYAEGQRRYVESMSSYARQFLDILPKPDVDQIEGLPPVIAIDQRSSSKNPRSTVGTITEIYDYLRILFARAGTPFCPSCGIELQKETIPAMRDRIFAFPPQTTIRFLAPLVKDQFGEHHGILHELSKGGFEHLRVDGVFYTLSQVNAIHFDRKKQHTIEVEVGVFTLPQKEVQNTNHHKQLEDFIRKSLDLGDGIFFLWNEKKNNEEIFSRDYSCKTCGKCLTLLEPRCFSFNSPLGACNECMGLGIKLEVDPLILAPNQKLSLAEGVIQPWFKIFANQKSAWKELEGAAERNKFSLITSLEKLSEKAKKIIFFGDGNGFSGVVALLGAKFRESTSEYVRREIGQYMREILCSSCHGDRLKKEYLAVRVSGLSISEVTKMNVKTMKDFLDFLQGKKKGEAEWTLFSKEKTNIALGILEMISERLSHIERVGLSYLSIDRSVTTLSHGESQRLRLSTQLSSLLVGVVYILDEPSIGLHPRDNRSLIDTLLRLKERGNSVIVVEHDREMILAAEYVIDIGPDAGIYGGEVVAQGTPNEIQKNLKSLTGKYLSGVLKIPEPKFFRDGKGKTLLVRGASANNLKNIDVSFPLGTFIAVTGVSGSGKSTLVVDILSKSLLRHFYRAKDYPGEHKEITGIEFLDKVITIDQSPIGRTPRSNPATYTGLFNYIRDLYKDLPEARLKGLSAGYFSFNVKEGRCDACAGEGMTRIDMQFLSDMYVECQFCHGSRYNPRSLEIFYKGKNIAEILRMTVSEAMIFFRESEVPMIYEKLHVLHKVGLGYVELGQSATTLSGGEAQRIKLATELSRRGTGNTLYILDEPTTGLHFEDIKRLLELLKRLVDKGNTVIVIEHNLDVIKSVDHVIDLGPEGGDEGGYLVGTGTPRDIAKNSKSYTGKFLKEIFL